MPENALLLSIVVPTYNRADLIEKTLQSLLKQSVDNYEIIIVDDGSTDNTEAVVQPFLCEKVQYFKKVNAERAAARNYGVQKAHGQYINFFDSDDIALDNHVQTIADMVDKYKQPEWFHLGFAWATPEGKVFRTVNQFTGETLNGIMHKGNPLSCNAVIVRRDIALAYPFNEDRALSASEDYELWMRLAARFPLYYTNTITSWVIDHELRSVRTINGDKLIDRLNRFITYITADEVVQAYFKGLLSVTKADAYSYIALHLAEVPRFKFKSLQYLWKALMASPNILTSRRFLAVIKNNIIKW
jgi:glycosyltransferase involved in cell wall biosynthesis